MHLQVARVGLFHFVLFADLFSELSKQQRFADHKPALEFAKKFSVSTFYVCLQSGLQITGLAGSFYRSYYFSFGFHHGLNDILFLDSEIDFNKAAF